jgi:hypothetical protein
MSAENGIGQAKEIIQYFQELFEQKDSDAKRMGGELVE